MAKRVDIPVKVTGSDEAQRDLKKVGAAVADVGKAGEQNAAGIGRATEAATAQAGAHGKVEDAVKKSGGATKYFDETTKSAAVTILGYVNPALAHMARLAVALGQAIVSAITSLSPARLVIIGVVVAIAGIVKVFQSLRDAAREAEEVIRRVKKATDDLAAKQVAPVERITEDLRRVGAFSRANLRQAYILSIEAMKKGVPEEEATKLAGVAFAGGLGAEDIALLAAARAKPETPEEAVGLVRQYRGKPDVLAELERAARAQAASRKGRQAMMQAVAIELAADRNARWWEQVEGISQDVLLLEKAKELNLLKPKAGIERIDALRARLAQLERLETTVYPVSGERTRPYGLSTREAAERRQLQLLFKASAGLEELGVPDTTGPVWTPGVTPSGVTVPREGFGPQTRVILQQITNVGTAFHYGVQQRPYTPGPEIVEEIAGGP